MTGAIFGTPLRSTSYGRSADARAERFIRTRARGPHPEQMAPKPAFPIEVNQQVRLVLEPGEPTAVVRQIDTDSNGVFKSALLELPDGRTLRRGRLAITLIE